MAIKTPIKATFTGSDVTGLAEYQAADFIGVMAVLVQLHLRQVF